MISICIPAYEMHGEGDRMLRQLLGSISQQNYTDYEVIVSDHSVDGQFESLCKAFVLPIKYVRLESSYGKSGVNFNNAIRHASGKFIKLMMQDDMFYTTDALSDMMCELERSGKDWIVSSCNHCGSSFSNADRILIPRGPITMDLAKGANTIGDPSVTLFKADSSITFDENLIWLLDCDFYYRYKERHGEPAIIERVLISVRDWEGSITNTVATETVRQQENEYVTKKLYSTPAGSTWTHDYWKEQIVRLPVYASYDEFANSAFSKWNFSGRDKIITHLNKLEERLGLVRNLSIVEFGGGLGLMAQECLARGCTDYTIIDLPQIIKYQKMLLGDTVKFYSEGDNIAILKPDLFISLWAISETTPACQELFILSKFLASEKVFIACQQGQDTFKTAEHSNTRLVRDFNYTEELVVPQTTSFKSVYLYK